MGVPVSMMGQVIAGFGIEFHRDGEVTQPTEIQPEKDEWVRMCQRYPLEDCSTHTLISVVD
jgi:hypothetical protein